MTFKVRETRYDTWLVYDDEDGVIHGEFIDNWAANDLRDFLELQDAMWYDDDEQDNLIDWEE